MSMIFIIHPEELRKALKEIDAAEKNGFMHCESVFEFISAGQHIGQCVAQYSDLIEKAHPTDGNLNWGRHQNVSKRNKFIDGKLVPIEK